MKRLISNTNSNEFVKYVIKSPIVFHEELSMDITKDISLLPDDAYEILKEIVADDMDKLSPLGLAIYALNREKLSDIIENITITVTREGAETFVTAIRELTNEEINDLEDYITDQFSDGWGKYFQQMSISEYADEIGYYDDNSSKLITDSSSERNTYYISFWNNTNFYMNITKL